MKSPNFIVWKTIKSFLILISFLIVMSCSQDSPDSIIGNPELDLENKGIERQTISYSDIELPDINIDGNIINAKYHQDEKLIDEKYYPNRKLIPAYGEYVLSSGKYKMRVGEAFICPDDDKYIYFHGRIRADEGRNEFWLDNDPKKDGPHLPPYERFEDGPYYEDPCKVRIYLDPPMDSSVVKYTTFGSLLTEYNFQVIIEIIGVIGADEIDNSCATIESVKDRSDTIVGTYRGRLISIFE
ncbi:hypothetical protein C6497_12935 [Candidatus Poribacteria bacterium]|nr:MAG: hypothetical protein C6497_12935 [Candidatus Poribacteria bacterium]